MELEMVKIVTLVDNDVWRPGLKSSWGLSFYVEPLVDGRGYPLLMDTSGSFPTLLHNASALNVDLSSVRAVFISHWHGDHCGSISHVLSLTHRPTPVYVPSASGYGIAEIERAGGIPIVCSRPMEVVEGVMSTGEIPIGISEHSMLINVRGKGLIILTGCSHPGVLNIVRRAQQVSGVHRIYGIMGGFHMSGFERGRRLAETLLKMGVRLISPCHCTHTSARMGIKEVMGDRYVENGAGRVFQVTA